MSGYDLHKAEDLARRRFADARASELSPTLNPTGGLAALTIAYAHSHASYYADDDADDMTVIADVFSDGRGSLVDVVRAPRDKRMLEDFESALRQDRVFVKAEFDRRPDTMRVIISFGSKVEVDAEKF